MTLIAQGAEAILEKEGNVLHKKRNSKPYRISALDAKLRSSRTKTESAILVKLQASGLCVPKVLHTDIKQGIISMEFIDGSKLRDFLTKNNAAHLGRELGNLIKKMHDIHIVHGDLTTSNVIVKDNVMYLIDFGLAQHSRRTEDKAVDLHVLKHSLEAYHWKFAKDFFEAFVDAYGNETVLDRLKQVEARGRNKAKY